VEETIYVVEDEDEDEEIKVRDGNEAGWTSFGTYSNRSRRL